MIVAFSLTNGLTFGVEHLSDEDDETFAYMIVIHLSVFKIMLMKPR